MLKQAQVDIKFDALQARAKQTKKKKIKIKIKNKKYLRFEDSSTGGCVRADRRRSEVYCSMVAC